MPKVFRRFERRRDLINLLIAAKGGSSPRNEASHDPLGFPVFLAGANTNIHVDYIYIYP